MVESAIPTVVELMLPMHSFPFHWFSLLADRWIPTIQPNRLLGFLIGNRYSRQIFLLLLLSGCAGPGMATRTYPQAVNGVLDLRGWDFAQNGPVSLSGEWEFYWEQLLTSHDFAGSAPLTRSSLIHVPDPWQGYIVNGQSLSGDGYATYRLTVQIDPAALSDKLLALQIPVAINTAHRLYSDGKLLGSAGQIGSSAETMTAQHHPYVAVFAPTGDQMEILLQIC